MIYTSICITLLTLLAALYFLAKVNREGLGSLSKWMTYLVILIAGVMLICQLSRAVCSMMCHNEKYDRSECCGYGMHHEGMCKEEGCDEKDMNCDMRKGDHHKMGCGEMGDHKMMRMEKDTTVTIDKSK